MQQSDSYVKKFQQLIRLAEIEKLSWPDLCRVIRSWVIDTTIAHDEARGRKRGR